MVDERATKEHSDQLTPETAFDLVTKIRTTKHILLPLVAAGRALGASTLNLEIALDDLAKVEQTIAALGRRKP